MFYLSLVISSNLNFCLIKKKQYRIYALGLSPEQKQNFVILTLQVTMFDIFIVVANKLPLRFIHTN